MVEPEAAGKKPVAEYTRRAPESAAGHILVGAVPDGMPEPGYTLPGKKRNKLPKPVQEDTEPEPEVEPELPEP
jgi:hypothetical protein